eukprot:2934466-Rhodomonas_salina.1
MYLLRVSGTDAVYLRTAGATLTCQRTLGWRRSRSRLVNSAAMSKTKEEEKHEKHVHRVPAMYFPVITFGGVTPKLALSGSEHGAACCKTGLTWAMLYDR